MRQIYSVDGGRSIERGEKGLQGRRSKGGLMRDEKVGLATADSSHGAAEDPRQEDGASRRGLK